MTHLKAAMLAATCLAAMSASLPAAAQVAAKPAEEAVANDAGEIVVTARKRQESILKVPVITNVLSQALIERAAIQNVTQVATKTPGVVLGKSSLEIGTQISIRGVGTTQLDPGIDSSTSLNLDGLALSQAMAFTVGLFDMQQIEVYKGPQALFYGKNSPAGVVSIRTADPGDKFEMIGRVGYEFQARTKQYEGVLSGPVTDTLGVRVAALYRDSDGYFKNIGIADPATGSVKPPSRLHGQKSFYIRQTTVWKPSPDFSARLKVNYTQDHNQGSLGSQPYSCPDGNFSYTPYPFIGTDNCKFDHKVAVVDMDPSYFGNLLERGGRGFTYIYQKFGSLELNWNPTPGLTVTSVTGYYNLRVATQANGVISQRAGPTLVANKHFHRTDKTQELRITSDWSTPFNFTAGAFYQDGEMFNNIVITGNKAYGFPAILQAGTQKVPIKSISGFVQGRYKIVPDLEFDAGVRYTDEKRHDDATVRTAAGVYVPIAVPSLHTKNWSPEVTINYTPTPDLTIFGSLKQAYKSGSYNMIVPATGTNYFGDEKVRGGEFGVKSRLFDRQVHTNLAFYYYKYRGLQVGANEAAANGLPIIRTVNAGGAKVYGIDFDASYYPAAVPGLSFNASANYNIAKFTKFDNAPCTGGQTIANGCDRFLNTNTGLYQAQDLSGYSLPRAPKLQAVFGGSYEFPLSGNMDMLLGADTQYSSKYLPALGNRRDFYMKKYAKVNANVTLKDHDGGWELAFIANNITDIFRAGTCTSYNAAGGQIFPGSVSGGVTNGAAGQDELGCEPEEGRTFLLRLTVRPTSLFRR